MMTTNVSPRKTALIETHRALKAKLVDFAGWLMPVSYQGVLAEHHVVRTACGLFDVSHMGEVRVVGPGAAAFLQRLTINDINRLSVGTGQYSAILNQDGGFIDDLIIYRVGPEDFLICVNASNADKDFQHFASQASGVPGVSVENQSDIYSQIAVQGPKSQEVVSRYLKGTAEQSAFQNLPYMGIMPVPVAGKGAFLARTGYTGEHGYELYLPNANAVPTWAALTECGADLGIAPIGLGARDTLRLEACYLLYGNDMDDKTTPLEAGISWAVRLNCGDFLGRTALIQQSERGLTRTMHAFKMEEDGIPRHGMPIYIGDDQVGVVTSGSVLPTVGGAGGMALVDPRRANITSEIYVDIRGKRKLARLVKKPLYKANVKS